MPITLTPSSTTTVYADGYYVVAAITLDEWGRTNTDRSIDMEDNMLDADKAAAWNRAAAAVDGYIDTQARIVGLTADSDATGTHMIGPSNNYFTRLQYLASKDMIPEIYNARGLTGDAANTAEGQMSALRKEARDEIGQILDTMKTQQAIDVGSDGAEVLNVRGTATSAVCYRLCWPYGGYW